MDTLLKGLPASEKGTQAESWLLVGKVKPRGRGMA